MNSPAFGLRVAGTIFGLVCVAQLSRLLLKLEIVVNGHPVPFWLSALAALGAGALALWLWKLSLPEESDSKGGAATA